LRGRFADLAEERSRAASGGRGPGFLSCRWYMLECVLSHPCRTEETEGVVARVVKGLCASGKGSEDEGDGLVGVLAVPA
jgi:hypothetical protein